MFFDEDGGVISCADGGCILVFGNFNVSDKVHDIIKMEKEEKAASKEE